MPTIASIGKRLLNKLWITAILFSLAGGIVSAQEGFWKISQLPIRDALGPVINNSGEIVWYSSTGIYSSLRGKLSNSGVIPRLANSGEVVYADWFGEGWDLVSTTRGRLTYGAIHQKSLSAPSFDVNSNGEVVYVTTDANNFLQVFSTIRNQITFDAGNHEHPCINDHGEIMWSYYPTAGVAMVVSSTRGILPGDQASLLDVNNKGEYCFSGFLETMPGSFSGPHIFSSAHGVIINDPKVFQFFGSLNDAGVFVWVNSSWVINKAEWIVPDTTPPEITRIVTTPDVLWPPNNRMVPVTLIVDVADNLDPSPVARIIDVTSSEPQNPSILDWEITGPLTVNLRAERPGKGTARVYTMIVECRDASGNVSQGSVNVSVPHDQRRASGLYQRNLARSKSFRKSRQ